MPEPQMSLSSFFARGNSIPNDELRSAQERELLQFISAVDNLIVVSNSTHFLTEIWLDELARLNSMPGPTGNDWRLVSLAASERLVRLLLDSQLRDRDI